MTPHPRPGIFHVPKDAAIRVSHSDLEAVRESALTNGLGRARLCAHHANEDAIHEMLIGIAAGSYVRPHRHPSKTESFHMIEGRLDVVLFDDDGAVSEVIRMGDAASGEAFYYRLAAPVYHTVLLRTPFALVHETTNGPFDPAGTEYAPWAPEEGDEAGIAEFESRLKATIEK